MIITKKKHNEIVDEMQRKINFVTNEKKMLEAFFKDIFEIQEQWGDNKMGNKKAITKIHEMFQFRRDDE